MIGNAPEIPREINACIAWAQPPHDCKHCNKLQAFGDLVLYPENPLDVHRNPSIDIGIPSRLSSMLLACPVSLFSHPDVRKGFNIAREADVVVGLGYGNIGNDRVFGCPQMLQVMKHETVIASTKAPQNFGLCKAGKFNLV